MITNPSDKTDPRVVANCLDKCVRQDVCYGCAYLDVPNGEYGECINKLMVDACASLRMQRYRIDRLERLHEKLKNRNTELRTELRKLRGGRSHNGGETDDMQRDSGSGED